MAKGSGGVVDVPGCGGVGRVFPEFEADASEDLVEVGFAFAEDFSDAEGVEFSVGVVVGEGGEGDDGKLREGGEGAYGGEEFQAADMAAARAWVSPKLELSLQGQRLDLRGDVEVPRAAITPPSFDSGIGTSSDQVI